MTNWLDFVSSLVVIHGFGLEDAWNCSMREYWSFHKVYLIKTGQAPGVIQSAADVDEFEEHLKSLGVI